MAFVVCSRWTAKAGQEAAVAKALEELAAPSRAEPGILLYQLHRDPQNARVFASYEQYASKAAYDAHLSSSHFQEHGVGDAIPRLENRERWFYETWDPS
jgi:quinol monooxygenase YgiN